MLSSRAIAYRRRSPALPWLNGVPASTIARQPPFEHSSSALRAALALALLWVICTVHSDPALAQVANQVASGDSVWAAVKAFFYGKWALVIGCLVLVGCVFAFFSKGALFASVGIAAVVIIYLLPAIAQGLQSLAQSLVGN